MCATPGDERVTKQAPSAQNFSMSALGRNVDDIALTKLDVLSDFDTIPIITAYSIDGTITKDFVTDSRLEKAEPVIEELPGWKCNISGCRS